MKYTGKKIILASGSPRRQELMAKLKLPFQAVASNYKEDMSLPLAPRKLAEHLSHHKAVAVAKRYKNAIIISADSLVVFNGRVLGKPHVPAEAKKMLRLLQGKKNTIITAFTVCDAETGRSFTHSSAVAVTLKKMSGAEIDAYVATKEPLDKAGAYAIQELGAIFIEKIAGDFFAAVGLPLRDLAEVLKKFDVNVLSYA
ncbi:septum formation protein Maf [Candidatus Falkowbacteria bacterium RIFOXYC2_FULL_47_12]|uniref:dTTP/UTP pyrophosphatase n=2 Tax=Candidatus Falkowiibacteriota TaxID=1752728 RepID=A0A1F5TLM5_9BACT|nr:MAG: septum formation protein Maf [Candidatus Falkowbacteria bacterium RIFOXYA2_FULL_47_9]OGF39707.1 MAG: septum formation protein Maf [Candidatus Falkowbacteria bacterium RIFOXYC2_FULL_47_12]